jgi:TetR/AcrR family transcriptional regulator, mexJK operon transcriptional repressor
MTTEKRRRENTQPRVGSKVDNILDAAAKLFQKHGYGETNMDAVANEAGVSKATVYVYFAGKHELFAAVIAEQGDHYSGSLIAGASSQEEIRAKLLRLARACLILFLAPEAVSTFRMVTAEAVRSPELGRLFYENGPNRLGKRLEEFFTTAMKEGKLRKAPPRRAVDHFLGLIQGDLQLCALVGIDQGASDASIEAVIRSGVDVFYRAYKPDEEA